MAASSSAAPSSSASSAPGGLARGSKRVVFVRHGQAEHNMLFDLGRKEEARALRDPELTSVGELQSEATSHNDLLNGVELAVVSPLRRALQTARTIFKDKSSVPFIALPDLQEIGDLPCDTGRTQRELIAEFPEVDVTELDCCKNNWFKKVGLVDQKTGNVRDDGLRLLRARCDRVTRWLANRPEEHIAVVAHHLFFCHLIGVELANCEAVEMQLLANRQWSVLAGDTSIRPIYKANGDPLTRLESPPLWGMKGPRKKLHPCALDWIDIIGLDET